MSDAETAGWRDAEASVRRYFEEQHSPVELIKRMTVFPYHIGVVHGGERDEVLLWNGKIIHFQKSNLDEFREYAKSVNLLHFQFDMVQFETLLRFFNVSCGVREDAIPLNRNQRNPEFGTTMTKDEMGVRYTQFYDVNVVRMPPGFGGTRTQQDIDRLIVEKWTFTLTPDYQAKWSSERFEAKRGPEPKKKRKLWPFGK